MKNCDNLFLTGQTEYENIHNPLLIRNVDQKNM